MKKTVLIVGDDPLARKLLSMIMMRNNMRTRETENGPAAVRLVENNDFDLILIDVDMPIMNDFDLIKKIRADNKDVPIIVVSGRTAESDMIYSLKIGADDYVYKPFNSDVLIAKVNAMLRRFDAVGEIKNTLSAGEFVLNRKTLRFYKNNREIVLSAKENAIMRMFMENINCIFTKEMIYNRAWLEGEANDNSVMVHISHLRKKIEDDPSKPRHIQTVKGMGYRFVP